MDDPTRRVAWSARPAPWRGLVLATGASVLVIALVIAALAGYRVHDVLTPRHLHNAVFGPPPTPVGALALLSHVWDGLRAPDGASWLLPMLPTQSGVLWMFAILVLAVAAGAGRGGRSRAADLAAVVVLGVLLYDITAFFDHLQDPAGMQLMDWVFTAIVAVSVWLLARSVWWSRQPDTPWRPALPTRVLASLALVLVSLSVLTALVREPDDAGFYTNLGAQRLRERGWFPYGDPLLSGSAAAGYGPVLFLAPIPFQFALDPQPVNGSSPDLLPHVGGRDYRLPALQASQLTTVALHLVGVLALWIAGRRLGGPRVAWALVALYCGSPFVLGVGGAREMIGGVTFISHIAPASLALVAFAFLGRPLLAGVFLALGVATVFAPVFFVPAWLGHYWHDRRAAMRFAGGMALAAVVVGGPVLARSRATPGRSVFGTVVHDTVGHHQGADVYGLSPFGFWGRRGGVRAWLRSEWVPGLSVSSPMFLAATAFAVAGFFLGRGRSPRQLAAITAALGVASQLWKIHGTGVYVNWYYPFLLLGVLAPGAAAERDA